MEVVASLLILFAVGTFAAALTTFSALWRRIRFGIATLRDELLVQASRRIYRGEQR